MRDKLKPYVTLPLWIVVYLIVAGYIGNMTRSEIPDWYAMLAKPPFNPPDFIFPVVWTTLYVMIAIAGWRIWKSQSLSYGKAAVLLFGVQTLMNWAWSYLFFDFHWLELSFAWILGLILCVAALIRILWKPDRITALILLPYWLWILFASYLNGTIWYLN